MDEPEKADPAKPGWCHGCRANRERTWTTNNDGRSWCMKHLREVIRRAIIGGKA